MFKHRSVPSCIADALPLKIHALLQVKQEMPESSPTIDPTLGAAANISRKLMYLNKVFDEYVKLVRLREKVSIPIVHSKKVSTSK